MKVAFKALFQQTVKLNTKQWVSFSQYWYQWYCM